MLLDGITVSYPQEARIIRSALASFDPQTQTWREYSLPFLKKVLEQYVRSRWLAPYEEGSNGIGSGVHQKSPRAECPPQ